MTTSQSDEHRRDLTVCPLTIRAATIDEEARTVEAVIATESVTQVFDMRSWEIIDEVLRADGAELGEQIPLLETHNRWDLDALVGSIRGLRIDKEQVIGRLFFAESDERAERAWQKVRQGHLTDLSVGYRVVDYIEIKPGSSETIRGKKYAADKRTLRITTRWTPKEGSLVAVGADENAKVRESKSGHVPLNLKQENTVMDETKTDQAGAAVVEEPKKTTTQSSGNGGESQPVKAEGATRTAESAINHDPDAIKKTERQRIARIQELASRAGDTVTSGLIERAISEDWNPDRAGREFLEVMQKGRPVAVSVGADNRENLRTDICNAIAMGRGIKVDEKARQSAAAFVGIGLQDIARIAMRSEHKDVGVGANELFTRAISTGTFTEILGDAATKSLHAAYEEYPATFPMWAGVRDVRDFKEYRDLRLSAFGALEEVGEAGEIAHGALTEVKEVFQAKTYAMKFTLSRKWWINDDLGAFLRIPSEFGQASKRSIDDTAYALLISAAGLGPTMNEDSLPLFDTTRTTPNYKTGATASALSDAGMTNAKVLMRKLTGLAGENLNIVPVTLLVPPELEHVALKLVESQELMAVRAGTTDAAEYFPTRNIHRGTLNVVTEPKLSGGTNGTTAWYVIASPTYVPSMVQVFLRGRKAPTLERHDPENVLGLGWRVYFDFGVAAIDWRGIVRSKGA